MDAKTIAAALRHYECVKKCMRAYHERKRQEKKDAGTYRGRGRPRKIPVEKETPVV